MLHQCSCADQTQAYDAKPKQSNGSRAGDMSQVVELLPNKPKALSSNSSTAKKKMDTKTAHQESLFRVNVNSRYSYREYAILYSEHDKWYQDCHLA
jgi:hypothetical protein